MKFKVLLMVGFVLAATAGQVQAGFIVVSGTGAIGDGVSLSIENNAWSGSNFLAGQGTTVGGKIYSPSGDPDLFFQAADTPTFPGVLETFVQWGVASSMGEGETGAWEGAQTGSDNWMKVKRDSDGAFSWAQFEFDFVGKVTGDKTLLSILLYVQREDGADFTLAEAVQASTTSAVPEPASLAMWGLGAIGMMFARRKRQLMKLAA